MSNVWLLRWLLTATSTTRDTDNARNISNLCPLHTRVLPPCNCDYQIHIGIVHIPPQLTRRSALACDCFAKFGVEGGKKLSSVLPLPALLRLFIVPKQN
eukprot:5114868-Ditylum_brightwellii.AAC.1